MGGAQPPELVMMTRAQLHQKAARYLLMKQIQFQEWENLREMAALMKFNTAKCPSCRIVFLRPVLGSSHQMLCSACGYHAQCQPRQTRPLTLLPTVEVTDTSQNVPAPVLSNGTGPAMTTSSSSGSTVNLPFHGLHRKQESRDCHPVDESPCSSSSGSSSPTLPSSWLPLPPVPAFPLGMGSIRRHSYQLLEGQSASTPSRYYNIMLLHGQVTNY